MTKTEIQQYRIKLQYIFETPALQQDYFKKENYNSVRPHLILQIKISCLNLIFKTRNYESFLNTDKLTTYNPQIIFKTHRYKKREGETDSKRSGPCSFYSVPPNTFSKPMGYYTPLRKLRMTHKPTVLHALRRSETETVTRNNHRAEPEYLLQVCANLMAVWKLAAKAGPLGTGYRARGIRAAG